MYESYWQLRQKPFENCVDPGFYYPSESHQAAILKLRYAIENRREGALLAGGSGLGKTLIVTMLRSVLDERVGPFVHLRFPQMPVDQLMAYLAGELTGSDWGDGTPSVQRSVRRIEQFLAQNAANGRHAVIALDEAQLIEDRRALEAIRLLSNFASTGQPDVTVLLAAQPGLLPVLERTPQLEERLAVKCLIRPFNEQETVEYVSHRLREAGADRPIFEPEAMPTLQELTHGVARRINRLCDLAMLIGYAEQQKTIGAAQLEAVSEELVAVAPE
ncbi:MAG: AAA family ATPase [Planctomycetia bacterium]|nr:AAA family ATPase [Planctomycetia bacterium]